MLVGKPWGTFSDVLNACSKIKDVAEVSLVLKSSVPEKPCNICLKISRRPQFRDGWLSTIPGKASENQVVNSIMIISDYTTSPANTDIL